MKRRPQYGPQLRLQKLAMFFVDSSTAISQKRIFTPRQIQVLKRLVTSDIQCTQDQRTLTAHPRGLRVDRELLFF